MVKHSFLQGMSQGGQKVMIQQLFAHTFQFLGSLRLFQFLSELRTLYLTRGPSNRSQRHTETLKRFSLIQLDYWNVGLGSKNMQFAKRQKILHREQGYYGTELMQVFYLTKIHSFELPWPIPLGWQSSAPNLAFFLFLEPSSAMTVAVVVLELESPKSTSTTLVPHL